MKMRQKAWWFLQQNEYKHLTFTYSRKSNRELEANFQLNNRKYFGKCHSVSTYSKGEGRLKSEFHLRRIFQNISIHGWTVSNIHSPSQHLAIVGCGPAPVLHKIPFTHQHRNGFNSGASVLDPIQGKIQLIKLFFTKPTCGWRKPNSNIPEVPVK